MARRRPPGRDAGRSGQKVFTELGCVTCHRGDGKARGPSLVGVFGKPSALANGATVIADESYLRESILKPHGEDGAGLSSR